MVSQHEAVLFIFAYLSKRNDKSKAWFTLFDIFALDYRHIKHTKIFLLLPGAMQRYQQYIHHLQCNNITSWIKLCFLLAGDICVRH